MTSTRNVGCEFVRCLRHRVPFGAGLVFRQPVQHGLLAIGRKLREYVGRHRDACLCGQVGEGVGIGHRALIVAHLAALCLLAVPASAQYTPGQTYGWPAGCDLNTNCQLELIAGNIPVIYETPHGGDRSFGWPVRTTTACGPTGNPFNNGTDTNTLQQANSLDFYYGLTGHRAWVLKSRVLRNRLDLNRPLAGAACGYAPAMAAWTRYHEWLLELFALVSAQHGRVLHVSLHGHADEERTYIDIGISQPNLTAANLDDLGSTSTLASWLPVEGVSFTEILRSLGTDLTTRGFPTVPSWQDWTTEPGDVWPNTGWAVQQYGCPTVSPLVCSIQLEMPYTGWRDTQANRGVFSLNLRDALKDWLVQFGVTW